MSRQLTPWTKSEVCKCATSAEATGAEATSTEKRRGTVEISAPSLTTAGTSAVTVHEVVAQLDDMDVAAISGQGRYQQLLLACTMLAGFLLTSYTNAMEVLAPPTAHWCKPPPEFEGMKPAAWKNMSIPVDEQGRYDSCHRYDPANPTDAANTTIVPCEDWEFDLKNGAANIVSEWRLVCGRKWLLTFSRVTYMFASMVAVPVSGRVADAVGRRPVVCVSTVVLILGVFAGCFAKTFPFFVVNRMLVSAAISVTLITLFVLLFEVNTPAYRALYSAFVHIGITLGFFAVALLSNFSLDYQVVQVLFTVPASLLLLVLYITDESPRWLLATWNVGRASQVMVWIARVNGKDADPAPLFSLLKKYDRTVIGSTLHPFNELLRCEKLRRQLVTLCFSRFSIAFSLTGLIIGDRTLHYPWLRLLGTFLRVPSTVVTCVAVNTYGRNNVFRAAFLLTGVGMLAMALCTTAKDPILCALFSTLTYTTDCVTLLTYYIYSMELFPTVVRDSSFCVTYAFSRAGGAAAPFLMDLAGQTHVGMPYVFMSAAALTCYHIVQYLPETMSCNLIDTVEEAQQDFRKKLFAIPSSPLRKKNRRSRRASKETTSQLVPSPLEMLKKRYSVSSGRVVMAT